MYSSGGSSAVIGRLSDCMRGSTEDVRWNDASSSTLWYAVWSCFNAHTIFSLSGGNCARIKLTYCSACLVVQFFFGLIITDDRDNSSSTFKRALAHSSNKRRCLGNVFMTAAKVSHLTSMRYAMVEATTVAERRCATPSRCISPKYEYGPNVVTTSPFMSTSHWPRKIMNMEYPVSPAAIITSPGSYNRPLNSSPAKRDSSEMKLLDHA
mmetsp:Transcript_36871/g.80604  ORF Transcript_36871/g.80604 Transcript_36871/m.80604 type:complete len:209 (-) Transcript_36871:311-937(-)